MDKNSRDTSAESSGFFDETWFDPIEIGVRDRIRGFIEALVDEELNEALGRARYRRPCRAVGAARWAPRRCGRRSDIVTVGGNANCSARSVQ
jgi:hypothetical protein